MNLAEARKTCKPGSVTSSEADGHLSSPYVATGVMRPTRGRAGRP